MKKQYKMRFGYMTAPTKYPSVFERQTGGYIVRGRATDLAGQQRLIFKLLPEATLLEAVQYLDQEKGSIRTGSVKKASMLFSEFAASVFARKVLRDELEGSEDKWKHTLTHLIMGTTVEGHPLVRGFGDYPIDAIRGSHVEAWKDGMTALIKAGAYKPTTLNSWISILKVISKAASREYEIRDFMDVVEKFSTKNHVTYTEEAPNALKPKDIPVFLECLKEFYPQHYAMALLGFVTGLRPSSLRPLRRRGPEADISWEEGRLKVRRSEVRRRVLNRTKQGTRYSVHLCDEVLAVLKWHIETQLNEAQEGSDLLFPSIEGGFRDVKVPNKPFAHVATEIGLGYPITQRGMRRTFNDLARSAQVHQLVSKSISGHSTDEMVELYSSIDASEQRVATQRLYKFAVIEGGRGQLDSGVDSEKGPSGQMERKSA